MISLVNNDVGVTLKYDIFAVSFIVMYIPLFKYSCLKFDGLYTSIINESVGLNDDGFVILFNIILILDMFDTIVFIHKLLNYKIFVDIKLNEHPDIILLLIVKDWRIIVLGFKICIGIVIRSLLDEGIEYDDWIIKVYDDVDETIRDDDDNKTERNGTYFAMNVKPDVNWSTMLI